MKKTIIKFSIIIIVLLVAFSIYFIFIKVEMSNITKIICEYFEDIEVDKQDGATDISDIRMNDVNNYVIDIDAFPIIRYDNSFYQFTGYILDKEAVYIEKNIDLCYIIDKEDIYVDKNITKNVYELRNISMKYAFAYKDEEIYYLYMCLNGDTDIREKMGNFDELFNEVNRDEKINFYEITVSIYNYNGNDSSDKSFVCYGDIHKLIERYISGKGLENIGNIAFGRKTENIDRYKEAGIIIRGYMEDTKCYTMLAVDSKGYLILRIPDIGIDTCFLIDAAQVEMLCQDILQNFDIYILK